MKDESDALQPPSTTNGGTPVPGNMIFFRYALLIAWMLVIWLFSAQHDSAAATRKIFAEHNFVVRKIAHFTEYAILYFLAFMSFSCHNNTSHLLLQKVGAKNAPAAALILAVLYATLDEIHQAFVPGRSSAITDVLVDSTGATVALFLLKHWRKRNPSDSA